MANWREIDTEKLETADHKKSGDVRINLMLSPYDIPRAIRGEYDAALKRFVIRFLYIGDEPTERREADRFLAMRLGKKSGRIYGIEVDTDSLKSQQVHLDVALQQAVSDAVKRLSAESSVLRRNYEVVRKVISAQAQELKDDLVSA